MNIKFFDIVVNFIFIQQCRLCNRILKYNENFVCRNCLEKELNPIEDINVYDRLFFLDEVYILFYYTRIVKELIHAIKFDRDFSAIKLMKNLIDKHISLERLPEFDLIIPVPLFPSRKRSRGYNQSQIIGKEISKLTNKKIYENILIRLKNTKPQSLLILEDRQHNIANAFFVVNSKREYITDKNILLVDDVFTTGFTTNECAKVLKNAGAKNVFLFALATAVL